MMYASPRSGIATLFIVLLTAGCATTYPRDEVARAVAEGPDRFMVIDPQTGESVLPNGTSACRSPAIDPRDGTRLRLVRSMAERGDYDVPIGRYGARAGELLRLDCRTGGMIGLVPR